MLFRLFVVFCLSVVLLAAGAEAQERAIRVDALTAGRLLYEQGRFEEAREVLRALTPASEQEEMEQKFLLGLLSMEEGAPRRAVEIFESILSRHPHLLRVRLELARAYFHIGDDDKARHHFSHVLGADSLPLGVENNVEAFLNHIQARKRWSADFSLALLPQSNVNQGTEEQFVQLGNLPLRLNEEARKSSGVGLQATAGIAAQPQLGSDWRGRLALSTRLRQYEGTRWDDSIIGADVGLLRLFDGGSSGGGLRVQRRWIADEGYSWRRGLWGTWQQRLTRRNSLQANMEIAHLDHDEGNSGNGWIVRLAPDIHHGLAAQSRLRIGLQAQVTETREEFQSSWLLGAGAGITHGFSGGVVMSANVGAQRQKRRGEHPFFGRRQEELFWYAGARVLHREVRWRGFAPYLEYRYERNNANIDFFGYDNHVGHIGVTRQF